MSALPDPGTGREPLHARRYGEEADLYEAAVEPIFRPALQALLDWADLRPGERVLDVGAGPGLLALLAAERVGPQGYVLGVDVAEGMVRAARERAGGLSQVAFERQSANALTLPDASFDAALSSFALQFTDPARSPRELHRVLRPQGGRLLGVLPGLAWGLSDEALAAISMARERLLPAEAVEWASEIDQLRKRDNARWAVLEPHVFDARMRQIGFTRVEFEQDLQPFSFDGPRAVWDWYYAGTGLRRFITDWPAQRQSAFHDEMSATLASVLGGDAMTLEWEVVRLRAER